MAMLLLTVVEVFVRLDPVAAWLPVPSTGSPNARLDYKLASLAARLRTGPPPDCFFVGSSMVDNDLDPQAFGRAYAEQSGQSIDCFNIGASGVTASGSALIAEYVSARFRPRLIVYGATVRDFVVNRTAMPEHRLDTPWFRSQRGEISLRGWLVSHSRVYGVGLTARNWTKSDLPDHLRAMRPSNLDPDGYPDTPYHGTRTDVNLSAGPDARERSRGISLFAVGLESRELDALQRIAALRDRGARVVVVELPVHPTYFDGLPGGHTYYEQGMAAVVRALSQADLPLIPVSAQSKVPLDGWFDRNHMNGAGAKRFSAWLGSWIGDRFPQQARKYP